MKTLAELLKFFSIVVFLISAFAVVIVVLQETGIWHFSKTKDKNIPLYAQTFNSRFLSLLSRFRAYVWTLLNNPHHSDMKILLYTALMAIATRIGIYILGYMGIMLIQNKADGFFNSFIYIWNKWDADHYLFIAQNWYVNQGDKKFLIVFYPLYPIIIKLINPLIHNYFLSGIIVSNLSLSAACFYLYKLTKLDFGEDIALSSVKYFLFFPASFFLGATFSESLFIALSVMTLYFCRKDKWVFAGLCGFLASLTRSLGILLIIPVVIEFLISCRIVQNLARKKFYVLLRTESAKGLPLLLIPISLLVYLYINKTVTGDWLKFLEYQKEHWHQSFGLFFENIKNFILNIDTWNPKDSSSLWIPQSAIIFFSLILVPFGFKRIRASYMAYAFVYLFVSISPTWLLSGPRYIMGIFPIYIILSLLSQSKVVDVILTFVSVISLCYCTLAFVSGNLIM